MGEQGKLSKKIKRKQAQYLARESDAGVVFIDSTIVANYSSESSRNHVCHIFIGNGGTRNGVSRSLLCALLGIKIDAVYTPSSEDYSFAEVAGLETALEILKTCNGLCVQDACKEKGLLHLVNPSLMKGPPLHLYLSFVNCIPPKLKTSTDATTTRPPGLGLICGFISKEEEENLMEYFSDATESPKLVNEASIGSQLAIQTTCDERRPDLQPCTCTSARKKGTISQRSNGPSHCTTSVQELLPVEATLRHRKVKHYGYEFLYGSNTVDSDHPLPGGLPAVCQPLLERMRERGVVQWLPDQLTVNEYLPGAGR